MLSPLLDQLDALKTRFGSHETRNLEQVLSRIRRTSTQETESLIRLHELLLFVCAYPQNAPARRLAESLLKDFSKRVQSLRSAEVNLDSL